MKENREEVSWDVRKRASERKRKRYILHERGGGERGCVAPCTAVLISQCVITKHWPVNRPC